MRQGVRWVILFTGMMETLVFTGNIFGWAALNYMLKHQGVYQHLCETAESNFTYVNRTGRNVITEIPGDNSKGCLAQDKMLNLAFTIGSFCIGFTAFIWGFLLDHWGLRTVRLLINGLVTSGTIMLSVTTKETSYLIFPGLTLMCLAGVPLRIANMQVANLFPKQRSTVISFYSGGFSASASIFAFIKYLLDGGLSWEWTWFTLIAMSAAMLPVTLFLLPPDKITDEGKAKMFSGIPEIAVISPITYGKFTNLSGSPPYERKSEDCINNFDSTLAVFSGTKATPLRRSILSFSFMAHQYWFSWVLLYTVIYVGTLNLWIERVTSDMSQAASFSEIYGLAQIAALILGPLSGMIMDHFIKRAAKEDDPFKKRLKITQSAFIPLMITTLTEAAIHVCKFYYERLAIYLSIVFITLLRSLFVGVGTAYLRTRFPPDHFNRLLGIMSTMASLFTLLQFPFFIWESKNRADSDYVNIVYSVFLLVALLHPLLMMVTPLQRRFLEKEMRREESISSSPQQSIAQ